MRAVAMATGVWLAVLAGATMAVTPVPPGADNAATADSPSSVAGAVTPDAALAHARELLKQHPLIDGHNDLPWAIRESKTAPGDVEAYDLRRHADGDTDLARLRAGGVGGQFWSVYVPGELKEGFARTQLEQIDTARRVIARYPDTLGFARSAAEIEAEFRAGRIASLLGIEGGHAIENSLGTLRAYYDLGVRYMTLTHNATLAWADTAARPVVHGGLTAFGREVVREMNRLGMLVDLSHVAPETMHDALDVSEAPVIFSHSNARGVCDVPRNVPDDVLRRLSANGGVVMVTFVASFISPEFARVVNPVWDEHARRTEGMTDEAEIERIRQELFAPVVKPRVTVAQVADHVEYIRKVAGSAHVGLGGDYDGNDDWPEGLSDVSMYPNLFAELIRRGWTDEELVALAGGNVLRALRTAEAVSQRLSAARPPSIARIEDLDGKSVASQ